MPLEQNVLRDLVKLVRTGRCVLFIGAGVPATEAGLPSGTQLAKALADELGRPYRNEPLPEMAQRYQSRHGRGELLKFLRHQLRSHVNVCDEQVCPTYRLIAKLPFNVILTTNFDPLLERVLEVEGLEPNVIAVDKHLVTFEQDSLQILKVHGDLLTEHLVITIDDYAAYEKKFPGFLDKQKTIFKENPVIFLGYGLNDFDFRQIYDRVRDELGDFFRPAYAVVGEGFDSDAQLEWQEKKVRVISLSAYYVLERLEKTRVKKDLGEITSGYTASWAGLPLETEKPLPEQVYRQALPKHVYGVVDEELARHSLPPIQQDDVMLFGSIAFEMMDMVRRGESDTSGGCDRADLVERVAKAWNMPALDNEACDALVDRMLKVGLLESAAGKVSSTIPRVEAVLCAAYLYPQTAFYRDLLDRALEKPWDDVIHFLAHMRPEGDILLKPLLLDLRSDVDRIADPDRFLRQLSLAYSILKATRASTALEQEFNHLLAQIARFIRPP